MRDADHFSLSVISLAFALKRLLESNHYEEAKHKLIQDFTKLKNRVQIQTRILDRKTIPKKSTPFCSTWIDRGSAERPIRLI